MSATNITETEARGNFVKAGTCKVTGETYRVEVPLKQYEEWSTGGQLIQVAMPQLSDDQREFLLTGMTPAEWADVFDGRDDESDLPECPNCGKPATFTEHREQFTETHGLDCGPYETWTERWLTCDECGAETDDKELAASQKDEAF